MCMAANTALVQAREFVGVGGMDPECVVTPGIFVNRVVVVPDPAHESQLVKEGHSYP
jgi:3-oxoadipate CoA-transferase, alpha subunit